MSYLDKYYKYKSKYLALKDSLNEAELRGGKWNPFKKTVPVLKSEKNERFALHDAIINFKSVYEKVKNHPNYNENNSMFINGIYEELSELIKIIGEDRIKEIVNCEKEQKEKGQNQ